MKKILIGIAFMIIAGGISAQPADTTRKLDVSKWKWCYYTGDKYLTDTLKISMSGVQVIVAAYNLENLTNPDMQFNVLIEDFQQYYAHKMELFPPMPRYKIVYYPDQRVLFQEAMDTDVVNYYNHESQDVRKLPQWNECLIRAPKVSITLKFFNDSMLMDPNLQGRVNQCVAQQTAGEWRRTEMAWASSYVDSTLKLTYRKRSDDQIVVNLYTGLGFAKSNLAAFADIRLGYSYKVYNYKREYLLGYDWNYSFAEDGSRHINSFVNVSVLEEGFLPNLKIMGGVDMGYLVHRSGDIYAQNTFRIGFGFKGDFFYFSPQIYFPGSFKGVYPGLRLAIGI